MKLSREAIQRMVEDRVGGGGGAGGGGGISIDDIQGMGFATEQWVNEKYLSIDFFNRLFKAYDSAATPNQVLPNDLESTITNIKAMFGFWTEQFVSALGYGPGGGGDTLTEPLASINNASLGMPTAAGQVITWNGSEWIFDIPQGGGGGGTGTVTSITAGTGLSGGTITTSGTISISNEYQTRISHGETAYGWGNHADAGYATQQWVNQQGVLTSSALSDYLPLSGGTLTGALHMGSESGASPYIYWGDGSYAYIGEDADDHITLRGDKGVNILTGSNYELEWNGNTLATQAWVGERYLSIDFFSSLFKAYTNEGVEVTPNNGNVSTIENIKAMFGFWTEQYVSALGKNSDGSGGLNALLQGLNESAIGSVAPTTAEIGKCLVWTANGWAWGTTGGGGGTGTVTSITAGTGLSGGTITTMGTIAISSTYQTRISHGETAYGWGNHADAGYATQSWVNQQGFLTSSALSDYLPLSGGTLTGALHMGSAAGASPFIYWGDGTYAYIGEDADDHITLRGDKGVNILTGSNYELEWNGNTLATQAWVEEQGFVTSSGVTSVGLSVPTGFTVSDSPVTTSGTLALGIASGYFMPTTTQRTTWNNKQDAISDLSTIRSNAAHGDTAYGWGNHANAGYLLRTEGMRFTDYGNYIAARFVTASGASDTERAAKAQGDGYIEWWASGGYFNHEMGWIRAKGNVTIGESTSDTTHYLQIGGARIYWDNANSALKLIKADGTACNLYATGGVTALQTS